MKKTTIILAGIISFFSFNALAQYPNLPKKSELSTVVHGARSFSNATGKDTIMIPVNPIGDFTFEVKAKVSSAVGRGMDIDARTKDGKGLRTSLDQTSFNWTNPLSATENFSISDNSQEQTFRYAVTNGYAHIYQNGKYLKSKSLDVVKDIVNGIETDPVAIIGTSNSISDWAGKTGDNSGKPTAYGWANTSTSTSWNTANSTSGVRYMDVTSGHTFESDGATFKGRLMYIRWDGGLLSSVYSYPVTLDANSTYQFSWLYEYLANASAGSKITVSIATAANGTGVISSKTFTTTTAYKLRNGNFTFTSTNAGTYYITFTSNAAALYGIANLSTNSYGIDSRIVIGKNYNDGAVNMDITSVTFDNGAYAPADAIPGTIKDLAVTATEVKVGSYVNSNVTLATKTDLHLVNSVYPLINSVVNLNSPDSWLFVDNMKPTVAIDSILRYVKVNNAPAVNKTNVRVAISGNGSVIIPQMSNVQPLEVFTEQNYGGDSQKCSPDTYYKNLGTLDNKIRSFKLKRGYMATLANNPDGTGYSRVFIADNSDLEVPVLPGVLDQTVSFIRVSTYERVSKKGWCQTGTTASVAADKVNATWFYSWSADQSSTTNQEYSLIRQNGGWPSWSQIWGKENVSHLLGFNEPDHTEQSNLTVSQAVAQWPDLLKSGLRVGSPACTNFTWLYNFMDSCKTKNYRVDYVAIHAYWANKTPQSWYNDLKAIHEKTGRPIWITEWNNGANWTTETWPTADRSLSDANAQKQLNDLKNILQVLDTAHFVERYAIYNWVQDCRKMINADTLTLAGKYYAANPSDIAFNRINEVIPAWSTLAPGLGYRIANDNSKITLNWTDPNGDLGTKVILERRLEGEPDFSVFFESTDLSILSKDDIINTKAEYRIKAIGKDGTESPYSPVITFVKDVIPDAPKNLSGEVLSTTIINLKWKKVANALSYNLKRSLSATGPFETISAFQKDTVYVEKGLTENTTYYYKVSSLNTAGEGADTDPLVIATKPLVTPNAVTGATIASGDAQVVLDWDFMYDAKFNIKRSASVDGPFATIAQTDTIRYIDKTAINGLTYYYVVSAENIKGESANCTPMMATPQSGQFAYWSFDENADTKVMDVWGAYNGTLASAATWTTGKSGSAVSFDGTSNSYIHLKDGVVSNLNDFTISTWANIQSLTTNSRIFDFGSNTSTFMVLCPKTSASAIRYKITYNGLAGTLDVPYTLPTSSWVHIALTQAGDLCTIYVDGNPIGSGTVTLRPSGMGVTTNNNLVKSQFGSDPYLNCKLDEFKIYNRALSAVEIAALQSGITTGISSGSQVEGTEVMVYPNPVQDVLHIKTPKSESNQIMVEVYNCSGQKMISQSLCRNTENTVNVSRLPIGLYVVKVVSENETFVQRLIKR